MLDKDLILYILKKHAKKRCYIPSSESEPDIEIVVYPEADEEYQVILKWLDEA